jgi:hypothetical protein
MASDVCSEHRFVVTILVGNDLAKLSAGFEVPRRQQRSADTPALW